MSSALACSLTRTIRYSGMRMEIERVVGLRLGNDTGTKSDGSKYSDKSIRAQNSRSSSSFLNFGNLSCFFIKSPFLFIKIARGNDANHIFTLGKHYIQQSPCIGLADENIAIFSL